MRHRLLPSLVPLLAVALLPLSTGAEAGDEPPADEADAASGDGGEAGKKDGDEKEKRKTIAELTEESDRMDGLFTVFRDRKTGEMRLLLDAGQLGKTYLYFSYVENGVSDAGFLTRGAYQTFDAKVFSVRRFYNRIEFVEENTRYTYDPAKAISRAARANVSPAVIFDEKIESEDEEKGVVLIKADGLFLTDAFYPLLPLPDPEKKPHEVFSPGKLSREKSKIRAVRNYPENTDVVVEYVFENDKPYVRGSPAVTDPRFISVVVQHSLLRAPETPMEPRFDDPRVGYFLNEVTDLSSLEETPYRDPIRRWRLEKKDPAAAVSEPKKPIVFWIENTTPVELRPIIEAAALRWNEAFEQAGFRNAVRIEQQPDEAAWEAGDLRYNVIRWVASPEPFYGGYGPSFVDPRTGEVLGADIMLEHVVIGNVLREFDVLGDGAGAGWDPRTNPAACAASWHARNETLFAAAALEALGAGSGERQRLLEEFLYFLTLHEIGHTLGLSHNFRSSHLHSLEAIFDPAKTYPVGLYGSVMDYPAVPFRLPGEGRNQYWTTRPGPYDRWAIEFGYSPARGDAAVEKARLEAILARSTRPELAFGNDADDMRSPGKAIDPRAMTDDMTSDPIGFAQHQVALVRSVQPLLAERLEVDGKSHQRLRNGYLLSVRRLRNAVHVISRFIGGVYVDRSMVGQEGAGAPLVPVPAPEQQRAMRALDAALFAPDAFASFDVVAGRLLAQRRGWDHFETTEDPKLHELALGIQKGVLDHLLHPRVLARITDTTLYGNGYPVDRFLAELTDAVFAADLAGSVNTFRQNLQLEFVDRLLGIVNGKEHDRIAQSMALNRLRWIDGQLANRLEGGDLATQAHREHVRYRIETGLEVNRKRG